MTAIDYFNNVVKPEIDGAKILTGAYVLLWC